MNHKHSISFLLVGLLLVGAIVSGCTGANAPVTIRAGVDDPKIAFAVEEIRSAFSEKSVPVSIVESGPADIVISVQAADATLSPEGFSITKEEDVVRVSARDAAGAMYGGLEVAEQIRLYGLDQVQETTQNPYMELRGTKFNIPLDVRTPSYSDASDAAQKNIPEMWSFDFWEEYIDTLARYRFNFISLWSLQPFPSLVRVPDYPDVALDDVLRSTTEWQEYYHLHGTEFDGPEIRGSTEVVKKLSIEEKIEFWKRVMRHAKDRNVDFYVITWNIFTNGIDGKYGITDDIDNPVTQDYFRKSVKQMFLTYPDLAGVGLTTGENMEGASFEEKEDWAFETYARGILEAAEEMPERRFTFIHRQHQTGALDIAEKFRPVIERENIEFLFSFKYAQAHVFSATTQPFHEQFVRDIEGMKTIWTLRNDDNYYFRWGAPDFVREFIRNIPYDVSRGFYYGSDQYIWGREFLSKEPSSPRQLEIVKHWYHWMMWGRLGYNPNLPNTRFIDILKYRFPEVDAGQLFIAWQEASMVYPVTTGFHWGALDFQWYIEACKSRPSYAQNETGFHDVNRFITLPPHVKSGYQSIPDYVAMIQRGASDGAITPLEVAQKLHDHADKALGAVELLSPADQRELRVTLNDIRTMAALGDYYGYKIAGATNLALYRATHDKKYQDRAVEQLTSALESWKTYVGQALQQNENPLWTNRVGYVDWMQITEWVEQDIAIAAEG